MTVKEIKKDLLNIRMFYLDYDFYLSWRKNSLTMDTVISTDKIVEIDEKLTIVSLKRLVSYRGDIALNLYRALIKDLYFKSVSVR